MNNVVLLGRVAKDPDIRETNSAKIARYTLAVDRPVRDGSERQADFISCVSFNNQADFVEKYLKKGTKILVDGRIQTGSYTNRDGQKVYTTDVVVNHHEFVESKASAGEQPHSGYQKPAPAPAPAPEPQYEQTTMDGFMDIPDDFSEDGLPFN